MRLISQAQYLNTVRSIFGPDAIPEVSFAPFQRTEGLLAAGAVLEGVTTGRVENYQRAASRIARNVVSPEIRAFAIPCKPADPKASDQACATQVLSTVGRRIFRRPLPADELEEVVGEAGRSADRLKDFYRGLALALEGMLYSPKMLYITDVTEPDPRRPGQTRLDAYSLASRLSFFLWNTAPDAALLDAAARGELSRREGRARVVDAMLASPKFETGVRAFFDDMLGFDEFETLAKDSRVYPAFTGASALDAREQTLRFVTHHLLTEKGDYRDLFTARSTFISRDLAPLYRQPVIANTWARYEATPDSPRAGLLTQISFLALHSHPGRSSPTRRGKALRELILCQPVPRPPPNVDFSALENPPAQFKTTRDRIDFHLQNPVCAGCHKITDPLGLGLENFDGAGVYRQTENGVTIDASGTLDGSEFKDAAGLGQVLHDHPAVPKCLVRRAYSYAVGQSLPRDHEPLLDHFNERFAAEGYGLSSLMRMIALSDAFAGLGTKQVAPAAPETTAGAPSPSATAPGGQETGERHD